MASAYILVIVCGLLALAYGVVTSRSVLAANAGSARMQEISGAVQIGASAYLNRQYRTIAIVGVVILFVLGIPLGRWVARRLSRRRGIFRCHGVYRHERVGARQCAYGPSRPHGPRRGLDIAFRAARSRACWWSGSGCSARGVLLHPVGARSYRGRAAPHPPSPGGTRFRRLAHLDLRAAGGGIFTKGADVGADLVGKVEAGIPDDTPATGGDRRLRPRQCRQLRRHGGRLSRPMS